MLTVVRTPTHPLAGRIQGSIDRLRQSLVEVFDEASRKRGAPVEPTDGLSDAKRQRLGAEVPSTSRMPRPATALPPGPVSYAQLFTLTEDQGAKNFDVKVIPLDLVMRLVPPLLASIDRVQLDTAINVCSLSIPTSSATSHDGVVPKPPAKCLHHVTSSS